MQRRLRKPFFIYFFRPICFWIYQRSLFPPCITVSILSFLKEKVISQSIKKKRILLRLMAPLKTPLQFLLLFLPLLPKKFRREMEERNILNILTHKSSRTAWLSDMQKRCALQEVLTASWSCQDAGSEPLSSTDVILKARDCAICKSFLFKSYS